MPPANPFADLDPELRARVQRLISPAHLAQHATSLDPPEVRWKPAKHLMYMNRLLVEACTSPAQSFLDIAASVRHGKSELISRYLPVWYLMLFPNDTVIIVSYNETKAAEWGKFTRDLFGRWAKPLAGLELDADSKLHWSIKGHRGGLHAMGVDGSLTGIGGNLIAIDDPVKNAEAAASKAQRDSMWDNYHANIRTRLMPGGTMLLTMARWHEEDLTGRLEVQRIEKPKSDPWEFVRLPAIAEAPVDAAPTWRDELGRKDGDPLWPEMWPIELLETIRETMDPAAWQSLYQQNPTPPEGDLFKVDDFIRSTVVPDRGSMRRVRFWDTASKKGAGDWSVGALVGVDPDERVWILDIQRFRDHPHEVKQRIKAQAEIDGWGVPVRWEKGRNGEANAVSDDYIRLLMGRDADAVRVADGDKAGRAAPFASQVRGHNVYVPSDAPWLDAFLEEARTFPKGRHDDQIDACVGGFTFLVGGGPTQLITTEDYGDVMSRLLDGSADTNPFFADMLG